MASRVPQQLGTVGLLLFMAIWLTGWSVGVAFLQSMSIADGAPNLFLFTHGGAEIFVLWFVASTVKGAAEGALNAPFVEHRHDGVKASWSTGSGAFVVGILGAVLGLVAHGLLFGSLVYAISEQPSAAGNLIAAVLALVWSGTAFLWTRAVFRCLIGGDEVTLSADLDQIQVHQKGRFTERLQTFPLFGTNAFHTDDRLLIENGDDVVEVPMLGGPGSLEIVDAVNTMAARVRPAEAVPVPEALQGLMAP